MKLFKKVLAVALVGAMAVSMLTACRDSSKTADIKGWRYYHQDHE